MGGSGGGAWGTTCGRGLGSATGIAAAGGRYGRGSCMTGTLTSGYLGLLDLTLNSTFRPRGISNPCGNASMAVNDLPGCVSLICAPTPGTLTPGSDNCNAFVDRKSTRLNSSHLGI